MERFLLHYVAVSVELGRQTIERRPNISVEGDVQDILFVCFSLFPLLLTVYFLTKNGVSIAGFLCKYIARFW